MTAPQPQPIDDGPEPAPDATDLRMADMLRESSSAADLRRELQDEGSAEASDLLSRLNALDFVQQVVGNTTEVPLAIGSYQIKGVLGRGGMGTVYLGWQQDLEREVALKVLSPTYSSDPTMRKRFRAEARATAALHHRHIVPIYDYGEAQGVLFFAMERVHGMSLDKHIAAARRVDKKPMPPLEAARRFAGVADALGLAHRRRLLHRDVKPGNILVGLDGTLALTDFGLAKALDHASMRLTSKGGGFLGTLHYAPPEQALGAELTPASDLYSLGVTMFEAITGVLPLAGKTTEALLQSILHGTPRRLRECVGKPPRDLEAVVDKLLGREPGDRYQDGEALARDLLRIADGEPVHIRRQPWHVRLWRRMRKNPVLSGAIAAAVVLLLVTLALLTVLRRETGKSLVTRHQQHLGTIARAIGGEAGPVCGPPPLLRALTGEEAPAVPPSEPILREFDRAAKDLPDDPQVALMRAAYVDDPDPVAAELLGQGRGYEALRRYDRAIAEALPARIGGDLAVELRLYRLYLARAVANLTAAVARPEDALTDLALATYLRPGAVFPRALRDVLAVVRAENPGAAAARLQRDLQSASAERVRLIGLLFWSAAGLRPPAAANLMDFGLGYQKRRSLHELATLFVGNEPGSCGRAGQATGLSAVFGEVCREAFGKLGEPAALRELAERAAASINDAVHPESPLQGWRCVMQMLTLPPKAPLVDRDQRPLAPALQLAAWQHLLRLPLARATASLWLPRFEQLRLEHPGLPGIAPVAARLHWLTGSPDAERLANAWVVEGEGDPEAQLCRMRVLLGKGLLSAARDDGIAAAQESVDPAATLQDVVQIWRDATRDAPGSVETLRAWAAQFADAAAAAAGARGGR